jgi:copper(I)-binding protein
VIRNSRRVTALAIAGALTLAPAVTGCGTNPGTTRPAQLTEGVNVSRSNLDIQLRNLFVLGPAEGQTLSVGAAAPVYATLINSAADGQPDKLVAVSSNVSGQPTPLAGGGLDLPAGQAVSLNGPSGPLAVLSGLTKTLTGGGVVEVALQFQRAGVLTVMVPVVSQRGAFQTYPAAPTPAVSSPTVSPNATPSATPAAKKAKKAKKSTSPSPTVTPTA